MNDEGIERILRSGAAGVAYPETPDLAAGVMRRLGHRSHSRRAAPRLAWGILAAFVILAIAFALAPSRDAIARLFGVEGSRIERLAPGAALPRPDTPVVVGTVVGLGEAPEIIGFEVAVPLTEEALIESLVVRYAEEFVLVLRYPAFDLWQAQIEQDAGFGKGVLADSTVQETSVRGVTATWLGGAPHSVGYLHPNGNLVPGSVRTVERNTLIWRTERAFYRLETDLPLEEAVEIAETLP